MPLPRAPSLLQFHYIDVVVVLFGYVDVALSASRLSWIRAVRELRPLKVLSKLKGLRVIVLTLVDSLGQLGQASILVLFLFTVYSIICVQVSERRVGGGGCIGADVGSGPVSEVLHAPQPSASGGWATLYSLS